MKSEIKYPTNAGMVNSVSALLLREGEGGSETEVRWAGLGWAGSGLAWLASSWGLPQLGPLPVAGFAVCSCICCYSHI